MTAEVSEHLTTAGVDVKPYDDVVPDLVALAKGGTKILMDPSKVSLALYDAALAAADAAAAAKDAGPRGKRKRSDKANTTEGSTADGNQSALVEKPSPVYDAKAIKNEQVRVVTWGGQGERSAVSFLLTVQRIGCVLIDTSMCSRPPWCSQELAGMREAHLRDGVALCKFFCWLEKTIANGTTVTEVQVDEKLTGLRAQQQGFVEPSFPTIAGAAFGSTVCVDVCLCGTASFFITQNSTTPKCAPTGANANGAIIHYRAEAATCATINASTLLLVDSGGQYDCGTTDITRTMHFGTPSAHQRACYTRVLQGHIALDSAVFPEQTPGLALDAFARRPLWGMGLNYRHGTGHGVGAALNVHEGPQSISTRWHITTPLQRGMVVRCAAMHA